uniref:CUB domain-containing protein n=1 Tax=Panagrolaimus sp. ES5 TaxID=591445 RepID=A0AC34F383_9BILA
MNFIPEMEFKAYISIIGKNYTINEIPCSISTMYNVIQWTIEDGYINNGYCSIEIVIPQKHMYGVIVFLEIEENVDVIRYNLDENNIAKLKNRGDELYFLPFNDGLERNMTFEFISDGSVQGLGFYVNFNQYGKS